VLDKAFTFGYEDCSPLFNPVKPCQLNTATTEAQTNTKVIITPRKLRFLDPFLGRNLNAAIIPATAIQLMTPSAKVRCTLSNDRLIVCGAVGGDQGGYVSTGVWLIVGEGVFVGVGVWIGSGESIDVVDEGAKGL
jgi:hypothetical protein